MRECQKKHNCEFYHSKIEKLTHFPQKIYKLSNAKSCDSEFRIYFLNHKLSAQDMKWTNILLFSISKIFPFSPFQFYHNRKISSAPPNPILHTRSLFFLLISSFLSFVPIWQTLRKPTICPFFEPLFIILGTKENV